MKFHNTNFQSNPIQSAVLIISLITMLSLQIDIGTGLNNCTSNTIPMMIG